MMAQTTLQAAEAKFQNDLAAMELWLVGAQDHANRQAKQMMQLCHESSCKYVG